MQQIIIAGLYMRPTMRLEKVLNKRLQFFSYQELVKTNTAQLREKHYEMEKQQMQTVSNILRTVRIDEMFKKQFHRIVLKVFNKIEPGLNTGKEASGTHKQIIADYTKFFMELKEKYILDFLTQIFQLQIYSQTTIIYVLVQLLLKYLRIKCVAFIADKIEPKVPANNKFNHFSHFMTRQNSREERDSSNGRRSSHKKRNASTPVSREYRKQSTQNEKQLITQQTIRINCKTIGAASPELTGRDKRSTYSRKQIRSANVRKNSISISNDGDKKPKRRIIKSFKDVREDTKQKIQRNIQNIAKATRQYSFTSSQAYYRVFNQVFREEWSEYFDLIGIQDLQTGCANQNTLKIPQVGYSSKKKSEWYFRNNDRVVVEACSRNDQIRKSMEFYTENRNDKLKN